VADGDLRATFRTPRSISALTERLDFTEKLLMRGDDSADTAD